MRVVVDTNVLISGLISHKSYPAKVIDAWISGLFVPVICREIVHEYSTVLVRAKFSTLGSPTTRLTLLRKLLELPGVKSVDIDNNLAVIQDDPKDNIFLECALNGNAKILISGDGHLLKLGILKDIRIITAEKFILKTL